MRVDRTRRRAPGTSPRPLGSPSSRPACAAPRRSPLPAPHGRPSSAERGQGPNTGRVRGNVHHPLDANQVEPERDDRALLEPARDLQHHWQCQTARVSSSEQSASARSTRASVSTSGRSMSGQWTSGPARGTWKAHKVYLNEPFRTLVGCAAGGGGNPRAELKDDPPQVDRRGGWQAKGPVEGRRASFACHQPPGALSSRLGKERAAIAECAPPVRTELREPQRPAQQSKRINYIQGMRGTPQIAARALPTILHLCRLRQSPPSADSRESERAREGLPAEHASQHVSGRTRCGARLLLV